MENKEKESEETSWAWLSPVSPVLVFIAGFVVAIVIDHLEAQKAERGLENCLVLKLPISNNSVQVGDKEIRPAEWRKMYKNATTEMLLLLIEESRDGRERLSLQLNLAGILGSTNVPSITPATVVAYSALYDCRQLRLRH